MIASGTPPSRKDSSRLERPTRVREEVCGCSVSSASPSWRAAVRRRPRPWTRSRSRCWCSSSRAAWSVTMMPRTCGRCRSSVSSDPTQPPFLIDSRLDIYRLEKLASVHGGMWLMANPSGTTEVTFELMRVAQADVAQARRLIAERDGGLRNDPDPAKLAALERAATLAEMLSVVGR